MRAERLVPHTSGAGVEVGFAGAAPGSSADRVSSDSFSLGLASATTTDLSLAWLELRPSVLERALDPFPFPVRTLDALHLASLSFLQRHGRDVALATYDGRMAEAAEAMRIPLAYR